MYWLYGFLTYEENLKAKKKKGGKPLVSICFRNYTGIARASAQLIKAQ